MPLYRIKDLERSEVPGSLLITDPSGVPFYTILEAKDLVQPSISTSWSIFQNNGTTPYVTPTSNQKNLVTEMGCKVNISATYSYPVPGANEHGPETAYGDWGTIFPLPNTPSHIFNNSSLQISSDVVFSTSLSRQKTGLIVVNENVVAATGNQVKTDTTSVTFQYATYFGFSPNESLNNIEIKGLGNKLLLQQKNRTIEGVSAGTNEYTYFCYPAFFGNITNIIQNDSLPIPGAFTRLSDVVILTDSGINISMAVYKSNATNAFTNVKLIFS